MVHFARLWPSLAVTSCLSLSIVACSNGNVDKAELSSIPTAMPKAETFFQTVAAMNPAVKKQVFAELRRLSLEDYYQWVAVRLTNGLRRVDGKIRNPAAEWAAGHNEFADLGATYATLGELWQALRIDPEHMKLGDLGTSSSAALALGDVYLPNDDGSDCVNQFSGLKEQFDASAAAIAAAYSKLPVSGKGGHARIGGTEIGIYGNQQPAKPNPIMQKISGGAVGNGSDAATFVWYSRNADFNVKGQGGSRFFSRCLKKYEQLPQIEGIPVWNPDQGDHLHPSAVAIPDPSTTS